MKTVTVSIGRNVKGAWTVPMGSTIWRNFQDAVRTNLLRHDGTLFFEGEGGGTWEGKYEVAYTFIVGYETDYWFANIKERLRNIAAWADQDAIAWTVGETEMIGEGGA